MRRALVLSSDVLMVLTRTRQIVNVILLITIDKFKRFTCVVSLTYDSTKTLALTDLFVSYCVYSVSAVVDSWSISDIDLNEILPYKILNFCIDLLDSTK